MKLILAPMATLSHEAFRRAVAYFGGCDEYYTEMINATSLLTKGQFEKFYLLNGPEPEKIVFQLTGSNADAMAQATETVLSIGGIGVDINMGCAAPEIYKYGAGIAWMLKPITETALMLTQVHQVIKSMSIKAIDSGILPNNKEYRLSVKIRLGDEDFTMPKLYKFADMLIGQGVSQIVLHPRTRKEKYTRPPKLQNLAEFERYVHGKYPDVSVIGNGAVKDFQSYNAMCNCASGINGVMIARAAAQKPWIFAEIKKNLTQCNEDSSNLHTKIDLFDVAERYTNDLIQYQPAEFYDTRSRRFFFYFCDNFMYGHYVKNKINNITHSDFTQRESQLKCLSDYFSTMPEEQFIII